MSRAVHRFAAVLALAACTASSASAHAVGASGASRTTGTARVAGARCGSAAGRTLAADARVRVYALHGSVYGCAGPGRQYRLGGAGNCILAHCVGPVAVAGALAAYGLKSCGIDLCTARVIVRRLSDGRQVVDDDANSLPLGPEFIQTVVSLVLRADGDLAWIAVGSSIVAHNRVVEVHAHDTTGNHLLDTGAAVRPGSLRLHGVELTWRHGRTLRSATLR
jgi:hypothetical protein